MISFFSWTAPSVDSVIERYLWKRKMCALLSYGDWIEVEGGQSNFFLYMVNCEFLLHKSKTAPSMSRLPIAVQVGLNGSVGPYLWDNSEFPSTAAFLTRGGGGDLIFDRESYQVIMTTILMGLLTGRPGRVSKQLLFLKKPFTKEFQSRKLTQFKGAWYQKKHWKKDEP